MEDRHFTLDQTLSAHHSKQGFSEKGQNVNIFLLCFYLYEIDHVMNCDHKYLMHPLK